MKSNGTVIEVREPQTPEGAIADLFEQVLTHIGEDPARDGLAGTPDRYAKALRFLTQGYRTDIAEVINGALFEVKYDEMVIVRDIEFFSLCEHHVLPFFGKMHVAYLPKRKVIGLSKIPRLGGGNPSADPRAARRGRHLRSAALLHDDARSGKATFRRRHQRHAGRLPRTRPHARGVSLPGGA